MVTQTDIVSRVCSGLSCVATKSERIVRQSQGLRRIPCLQHPQGGRVRDLNMLSEKGKDCTIENPWPEVAVVLYRNGRKAETLSGNKIKFGTASGESISIRPL